MTLVNMQKTGMKRKRTGSEASDSLNTSDSIEENPQKRKKSEGFKNVKVKGKTETFKKKLKEEDKQNKSKKDSEDKKKKVGSLEKRTAFKQRKEVRKKANTEYDVIKEAKKLWETLRRTDITKKKKDEVCGQVYDLIKGRMKKLMLAHDGSRIIQSLMKSGNAEHKNAVFEELKDDMSAMCKSTYGKFLVRKFLKYGSKEQKTAVFQVLCSHVKEMIKHKEASVLIEIFYNNYANAEQRAALLAEFYGSSFKILQTHQHQTLEEIIKANPSKKDVLMVQMKELLTTLCHKHLLQYTIVHKSFLDFFTFCSPNDKTEMIETVREHLVEMLHTKDGARLTMKCIWDGTAKDRKVIMKSFKQYLVKIAKEEYGYVTLCALMDTVDDTVALHKIIVEPLLAEMCTLAIDQYGRKVLLYILCARNPRYFHADVVNILKEGDDNPHSKKNSVQRQKEILENSRKHFIKFVVDHLAEFRYNPSAMLLMQNILIYISGDITDGFNAVIELVNKPYIPDDTEEAEKHFISTACSHYLLKFLIKNDTKRMENEEKVLFSDLLLDSVPRSILKTWITCNKGCFTFLFLIEVNNSDITSKVEEILLPEREHLKKLKFPGAQLLLKKLNGGE